MELKESTFKYMKVTHLRRWHVSKLLDDSDILHYGQLPMLEFILKNPGCNLKEVSSGMTVSRAAITKSIKRMEKQGVIRKESHPEDKRKIQLYATEKGEKIAIDHRNAFDCVDKKMFAGFSEEEIGQLNKCLDRMLENLSDDYQRDK